jgi:hypothetical protein
MSRRFFFAVSFVLCLPALLQAQLNPLSQRRSTLGRQQATMQPVEATGTITFVAPRGNGIVVSNGNNQVWKVTIVPNTKVTVGTKVQVTGTATASSLRSGLVVELTADLDNRNTIQGKVETLTITSLTRDKQMGVFADDAGFAGNDLDKSAKRTAKSSKGARAQIVGRCRIVGRLVVSRGGSFSVQSGRGTLPFELADGAKIAIDMADLSLARPGQEVTIKGAAPPRQPNMVQATEVTIKLPEVADADKAGKDAKAAKPEPKKAAKAPKKDKDEGLPEPGDSKPGDSKPADSKPADSK